MLCPQWEWEEYHDQSLSQNRKRHPPPTSLRPLRPPSDQPPYWMNAHQPEPNDIPSICAVHPLAVTRHCGAGRGVRDVVTSGIARGAGVGRTSWRPGDRTGHQDARRACTGHRTRQNAQNRQGAQNASELQRRASHAIRAITSHD